jgi:transposase
MLAACDKPTKAIIGDKGYDSASNRAYARSKGIAPVIPYRINAKNPEKYFAETLYKARSRIEQAFGKLKRFKRFAFRCEKTKQNYLSFIHFTASIILLKFVHTA